MKKITLAELAAYVQAEVVGDAQYQITGLAPLATANAQQLAFLSNPKYASHLASSKAGAVMLTTDQAHKFSGNRLIVANPYLAFAQISHLFAPSRPQPGCVHESAIISASAQVDPSAHIGPGVVIEADCVIGAEVVIGAYSVLGQNCHLGARTFLHPRVTLYSQVRLGADCLVHSGAVIGADGFGFAPTGADWLKIAQLGGVTIGDKVEIGANAAIDRGALDDTKIGRDVKIDNLVHLAHNVQIGDHTALAAFVGVSGSTSIGANCMIGGQSGFAGHISVCDGANFTGMSMVTGSITEPGVYSSGTGLLPSSQWRRSAVRFRQLDELSRKVKELEDQVRKLTAAE